MQSDLSRRQGSMRRVLHPVAARARSLSSLQSQLAGVLVLVQVWGAGLAKGARWDLDSGQTSDDSKMKTTRPNGVRKEELASWGSRRGE